jgi:hypothetical protein
LDHERDVLESRVRVRGVARHRGLHRAATVFTASAGFADRLGLVPLLLGVTLLSTVREAMWWSGPRAVAAA